MFTGRRPRYQLTGLAGTLDGLYDGSFVSAACQWWNHRVGGRKELTGAGYQAFTPDEIRTLMAIPLPAHRPLFEAFASNLSLPGRQSQAVLGLGYVFAIVIEAAASRPADGFPTEAAWQQAPRTLTGDELTELHRHYTEEGSFREYDTWIPYWQFARSLLAETVSEKEAAKTIESLRAVFDDQVDRWSVAEGFDLRRSVGAPDYSLIMSDESESVRLLNFVELLFEWGGRLRLAERLITSGEELENLRFTSDDDDFDYIDHLYGEVWERYHALAAQDEPPISSDIRDAAELCAEWLGEDLDPHARRGISTAAIRAYLWRTVEGGSVERLEPKLSEAVCASLAEGDDRSPDEPRGLTLYWAASQCIADGVPTRLSCIGGIISGPRSYERAFWDTQRDFRHHGIELDEKVRRVAFQFGMCLADSERVLERDGFAR